MMNKKSAICIGLVSALASSGAAHSEDRLEEVLVTAAKRTLALQDLAGSANVIGAEAIRPGGIQEVRDMVVNIPNLSMNR